MRNKKRVLGAAVVVGTAVITACLGPNLSSSSQPVIAVSQDPYYFGSVMVGTTVMTNPSIVISPQTSVDDDDVISIDENCPDFDVQLNPGTPLPAHVFNMCSGSGGSAQAFGGATYGSGTCFPVTYAFNATFRPNGAGSASCSVNIKSQPFGAGSGVGITTRQLMLMGAGSAPMFAMETAPLTVLPLGDVPIGATSTAQMVTLKNTGNTSLTVTGSVGDGTHFPVTGPLGQHTLAAPGGMDTFGVSCHPTIAGPISTMLTFVAQQGPMRSVMLTCRGIVSTFDVNPSPAAFPSTLVGRPPTNLTITLANPTVLTAIDSVTLDGTSSPEVTITANPAGGSIGSGSSATIGLRYAADTEHPSGALGNLVINTTPGGARNVTISGEALLGMIGTTPADVRFGPVCANSTSNVDVSVYAAAGGALQMTSVTQPASPFSVTGPSTGALQGNHGTGITLSAKVAPTAPGELESAFVINSNAPGEPMHEIKMTALALPSGVTATPDLVHFGPSKVNSPAIRELSITNCAASDINITAAHIEGANIEDFTIAEPSDPTKTVTKMGSTKFLLAMTPHSNGPKAARLVVDYEGGGQVIADLDGNGFGGDDGGTKDRVTYYACSSSHPGAVWPIALALLLIRRRRRAHSQSGCSTNQWNAR